MIVDIRIDYLIKYVGTHPNIGMSLKTMVTISNTSHVSTAEAPSLRKTLTYFANMS